MFGLEWLRWGLSALCCVPAATFVAEVLIGAPPPRRSRAPAGRRPRTVVLVPAHNEQAVIEGTLTNLRGELDEQTSLLVVADNCEDDTPALAERAGARVVRRVDPTRRGKVRAADLHESDYTPWEGHDIFAWPVVTILRGKVMVEDGKYFASPNDGRYLKRKISSGILNGAAL